MQSIVLLHGALGSDRQMEPLKNHLSDKFDVHVLCFQGHGHRDGELSIQNFSENLTAFLEENSLKNPLVFGYSMGGYVALYTEAKSPGTFSKIVTLGTKFHWAPDIAAREVRMLNPEIVEEKVPKFADHLSRMHQPKDWKVNMRNTAAMMEAMGENPPLDEVNLSEVQCHVHLLLGEKDAMVTETETIAIRDQLSNVKFDKLEGVEHPIEKLELTRLDKYL
ncbi:MAG: alpha/beta hydrolase [bacterium]|nr:alpha/beta hydrolase [bacterium]